MAGAVRLGRAASARRFDSAASGVLGLQCGLTAIEEHGKTEVEDFDVSFGCDHDVRRLQIAVDQTLAMRARQCLGDLQPKLGDGFRRQRTAVP